MSAIFISHSSRDNAAAAEIRQVLAQQGHRSIFLDFDPAAGIPAGRNWERELYANLRACQAVIVVCSQEFVTSQWCFAEVTHARALGKQLFPVRIMPCTLPSLLTDVQVIDLTSDPTAGYERLRAGLRQAGIDPANTFDWDGQRPPYPGLLAFQEDDAGIYFGRDTAIQQALETLNRLQHFDGARLVMVLGASGSGKSSLVRAGILPRLRRTPDRWLCLEPFRPSSQPFDEMALVLSDGLARYGVRRDWKVIRDALHVFDAPAATAYLLDLTRDLRIAAECREATVLLVVDQAEELLLCERGDSRLFLRMVRDIVERAGSPILLMGTLRSDYLAAFQDHDAIRGVSYEPILLPQMTSAECAEIITRPAQVAALELEEGLTDDMVRDTATGDALPLLAFTLRELWERYGHERRFTSDAYRRDLGGLKGAVARCAEDACRGLDAMQEDQVRRAFLSMVRLDDEGHYTRQPARWAALPEGARDVVARLVDRRLLVARSEGAERVVEVAHETLFRSWDRLVAWLNLDREFLLWRGRLQTDVQEWDRTNRHDSALLRGPLLAEAERWLHERRDDLGELECAFVEAGLALRAREEEEERARQERELTTAQHLAAESEKRRQAEAAAASRLKKGLVAAAVLLVAAVVSAAIAVQNARRTNQTLARADFIQASELIAQNRVDKALAYLARAVRTLPGDRAAADRIFSLLAERRFLLPASALTRLPGRITAIHFGADNRVFVAVVKGSTAQVFDAGSGKPITAPLEHEGNVVHIAQFSADGRRLATACGAPDTNASPASGYGRVWDVASGRAVTPPLLHENRVVDIRFNHDASRVVTASDDQSARVWDAASGLPTAASFRHDAPVLSARFSPDGGKIVTVTKQLTVWDVASSGMLWHASAPKRDSFVSADYSPDGLRIAVVSNVNGDDEDSQAIELREANSGKTVASDSAPLITSIAFVPNQGHHALVSWSGRYRNKDDSGGVFEIGDDEKGRQLDDLGSGAIAGLAIPPHGSEAIVARFDGTLVWKDPTTTSLSRPAIVVTLADIPAGVAVSQSGKQLAVVSGSAADTIQLWSLDTAPQHPLIRALPKQPENLQEPSDVELRLIGGTLDPGATLESNARAGLTLKYESDDSLVIVRTATPGQTLHRVNGVGGYDGRITAAKFSPDGDLVAIGEGGDFRIQKGFARIWDVATGRPLTDPMPHGLAVAFVAFTPDATRLLTLASRLIADGGGFAQMWDVGRGLPLTDSMRLVGVAEARAEFDAVRGQLTVVEEGAAETRDVAFPANESLPDWLPQLAELAGGSALNPASGVLEPVIDRWQKLEALRVESQSSSARDGATRLARWFLVAPDARTMSPLSDVTVQQYVAQSIADEQLVEYVESLAEGHPEWLEKARAKR